MIRHFGELAPFQHHHLPDDIPDQDQDVGDIFNNEPVINHQVFVKQPSQSKPQEENKDPDVWDPPTPKPPAKKKASNWGAAARSKQPPVGSRARAQAYRGGANPLSGADGVGGPPQHWGGGGGSAGAGAAKNDGRRNYDKPWLPAEKEKKEAKTYAEFVYPDGIGPDTDLINMIERDVLIKNPEVNFDDIADLDETKKLL